MRYILSDSAPVEPLSQLLARFVYDAGLDGAVIATRQGHALAAVLPTEHTAAWVAHHTAELFELSVELAARLRRGPLESTLLRAEDGYVMLLPVGQRYVLILLVPPSARTGWLFEDAQAFAAEVDLGHYL